MAQDNLRDNKDSHTSKDLQKGRVPPRPFNDNAPITRSITNSNKMMKDALITDTSNDGKVRREQLKEPKTATLADGDVDIDSTVAANTETPPVQTPPYNSPPIKSSPSTPTSPNNEMDDDSGNSGNGEEDDDEDIDSMQPAVKRWKSAGTT